MFTKEIEKKRFRRTIAEVLFLVFVIPLIVMSSVAGASSSSNASSNETIGKWEVYEITLTTTNSYSNPYKDVSLSATFNGPNSKEIVIEGFWDGGGNWKIRMAPTEVGTWSYVTSSNDSQLDGQTGSFEGLESGKKGFIKVNPDYPYSFMYADGIPFFWMGDSCWDDPGYTRFKDYIDLISSYGYNNYHTIVVNDKLECQAMEGEIPFERISSTEKDYDQLRPDFFKEFDKRVIYANSKDILPQLYFTWSQEFVKFERSQFERYVRYMVARYAAYDVVWIISGEYTEESTPSEYAYHGNIVYQKDPYNHPISIHPSGEQSNTDFATDTWLTYIMHQRTIDVHNKIISDRIYNKPVVNGESQYLCDWEITLDNWRKLPWSMAIAGGYFDTGYQYIFLARQNNWDLNHPMNLEGMAQMKHLSDFFSQEVEFWTMSPSDSLVTSGTAYCLANPGNEYVVYLPNGGSVTIDLSDASGTSDVGWYNPKNGTYYDEGSVTGGGNESFTSPFSGDAVLHIVSTVFDTGGGTYPSISGTHTGTIKPTDDIAVQKMYTYQCSGTGGHSEYVRIWNASGTIADGNWPGYEEDWHVIFFDTPFILKTNETYHYTIRTGSYPQIIHAHTANVAGGIITCVEFVNANGKSYDDWIPAIKLYSTELARVSSNITVGMGYAEGVSCGDIEAPATVLYNSYNAVVKGLFKTFKSIKELYCRSFFKRAR